MIKFRFSKDKEALLRETRGIELEEISRILEQDIVLDTFTHPTRENQKVFIIKYKEDVLLVPCVPEEEDQWFIKTAFPDRRYRNLLTKEEASNG